MWLHCSHLGGIIGSKMVCTGTRQNGDDDDNDDNSVKIVADDDVMMM